MFKLQGHIIILISLLLCGACTFGKKELDPPKQILSEYVTRTFAMKEFKDRQSLLELSTGEIKKALEQMDESAFKAQFVDVKKEFGGLKIRDERLLGPDKYSITYEIMYVEKNPSIVADPKTQNIDSVTTKKHVIFEFQNGKWLVSEVKNIKTYIEHQNEMSF